MTLKEKEETYITPKEAAECMAVSRTTIYTWIRSKAIKAEQKGPRLWYIPLSEVFKVRRG